MKLVLSSFQMWLSARGKVRQACCELKELESENAILRRRVIDLKAQLDRYMKWAPDYGRFSFKELVP